jgi:PAS domain S-box-containing protein
MMEDEKKTKKQLIVELHELRQCVAELKGFEKEIDQTRKFTKAFMQNSIPVAIMTSKEGRFVDVSDAFLRFTGRQRDEVIGRTSIECGIIAAEQRGGFYDELNKKGRVEDLEMEVRTKDGALRYGLFNAVMMSLNNEKYVLAVSMDITSRKQAEEALRKSDEKNRSLIDNINDGIYILDFFGKFTFVNDVIVERSGYPAEWFLGRGYLSVISEKDRERVQRHFNAVMDGKKQLYDLSYPSKSGNLLHVEVSTAPLFDGAKVIGLLGVSRDVTDRKQAEEVLRESEEKYRLIFQSEPSALFLTELGEKGTVIDANEAALRMYGYSLDEMRRMRIVEFSNEPEQTIRSAVLPIGNVLAIPLRWHRKKDGTVFPVEISGSVFELNGRGVMLAVHHDITDRKLAVENLDKERQDLKLIIDSSPIIIFYKDKKGRFVRVNKTLAEALKIPEEKFLGKTVFDFYSAEIAKGMTNDDQEVLNLERPKLNIIEQYESASGIRWVKTDKIPIFSKNGTPLGLIGFAQDITTQKQAEERIHASLREKDILLNEIHHRVKNNMQVISSLLKLQASVCGSPELTERLNESQSRIHAMAMVHEKLYGSNDFSRIDLAGYVRTLSQELFQSHKINQWKIALIVQTDGEVYVDVNKAIPCGLILNELISNALKHAFPGGRQGKLQILLRETENKEIEIVVRDNGLGLPDDVDIHAPRSLGLDLVNGLVTKQLDGQIEVRRDKGTEFRITFPL